MIRLKKFFLALLVAGSATLHAQSEEKILLPIAIRDAVGGGYRSLWQTRLTLTNVGSLPLFVDGLQPPCRISGCMPLTVAPDATVLGIPVVSAQHGSFLFVEGDRSSGLRLQLRIQDLSRQSQTWGTELPIVRERDALTETAELLDVPVASSFRSLLRVYDFDSAGGHSVRVRIYRIDVDKAQPESADTLLSETVVQLAPSADGRYYPGYAQLDLPSSDSTERLRIEVTPLDGGLRFWAFVSVTNNETQHVTMVSPQR